MKSSKFAKYTGACALALSCAAITPSYAQTGETAPTYQNQADDRDWGWIGLLGLIGLAGLMGRKRDTHHYDTNRGATTVR